MEPRSPQELESALEAYIADVLSGRRVVGRSERLAVERHVRDRERGEARGVRWDRESALRACWWIEHRCKFTKGRQFVRRPFILQGWQLFIVASIFGWLRLIDGQWLRRFRTAYVCVARKNGKTELAAAIALFMLTMCGEHGGEIYSAAVKREQAALVWQAAARMVKNNPLLAREIGVHESRYNLAHYQSDSKFEALASESNSLDGLMPFLAIVDELHAHPDGTVYDVLESGMGTHLDPLLLAITTAGGKRDGKCWDVECDGLKILEGIGEDEGTGDDLFVYVARMDEHDDYFIEANWPKSNPNLGVSVQLDKLRIAFQTARRRPSSLNETLRKHGNLWTETSTAWIEMPAWDACGATWDPAAAAAALEGKRGKRCWVGLDCSATRDYTAACAVFEPDDSGLYLVVPQFWIPQDTLFERERTDRVPIHTWVTSGLVNVTSGPVIDQDAVKDWLLNFRERHEIVEVPIDPNKAVKLSSELMGLGFEVVSMRQGWVTMSPAIQQAEILIRSGKLAHGGHPVLRWMMSNVAVDRPKDKRDNMSFHKGRSGDRIDGVVAMAMGVARAVVTVDQQAPTVWSLRA